MRCHLRLFDIKWGYLISNKLIWAQMTSHMSSNETHMRFGERWRRTAMLDRVSTLITGGVHIDHPHTTNIAGNSKWVWKFKIIIFCLIWDLKWENEVYRWSKIDEKNRCHEKKSSFPKIISYDPYGDQIWVPNSSPARRYLQNWKKGFFSKKNPFSWIEWFWSGLYFYQMLDLRSLRILRTETFCQ